MRTNILKIGLLAILVTIFCIQRSYAQITIYASGSIEIYDPDHPTATFDVSAAIETSDINYYPCTNPGNPIASGISQGSHSFTSLAFANVYPPYPQPQYPYRVIFYVRRTSPSVQNRTGVSDWAGQYGLNPWSPSPVKIQEFD
jgi:hypothetical protein